VSPRKQRETLPLAYVLYKRVGFRKATRAMEFVVAWGLATEELGHPVSMAEYTTYWHMSTANAYRDRDAWVAAAPGYDVEKLWASISDRISERKDRKVALMQMIAVSVT
jgi:hypothetical protein